MSASDSSGNPAGVTQPVAQPRGSTGARVSPATPIGRQLGDFRVAAELARGGQGAVYLAEQPGLERDAVVKIMDATAASDRDAVHRFLREAKLASRLDHPFAAHVYAFGAEPDGLLWVAMERVRGVTLEELLHTEGPQPLERFVPLLDRLCACLHTAHEQGLVHRDIKPANLMIVERAGQLLPKLLDFGIAAAPRAGVGAADAIGSPGYMAPEQWRGEATPRTDIYALGTVLFEALAGHRPFSADTPSAWRDRHERGAVPALPASIPAGVGSAVARALAKHPDQRYATALAFAHDVRQAAGLDDERTALPRLDAELREAWIARAPEPLAEAVAALAAARNPHQARDGALHVQRVAIRYVAVLALACHARQGRAPPSRTADAVAALGRTGLDDAGWLELARAVCGSDARGADDHPLPALVAICGQSDAAGLAGAVRAARELRGREGPSAREARAFLTGYLPRLEAALAALAFALDYPLAVVRDGIAERYTGIRRQRRPVLATAGPLVEGAAVFAPDGRLVAPLTPLAQRARPAPGVPPELFWLDGRAAGNAALVAWPAGFARDDPAVWSWLREHLGSTAPHGATPPEDRAAPYPGLAAFSTAESEHFFGREREALAVRNRLQVEPLALVVGPSGAGKSSFVHAGVIPALPPSWQLEHLRPGAAPLTALAALAARLDGGDADAHRAALGRAPGRLGRLARAHARARGRALAIFVDQGEELFTQGAEPLEQARVAEALASCARSADDPVRVLVAMRDDFLVRAEALPALRHRLDRALHVITTPGDAELYRIVTEPARRAGYRFEDDAMVRDMLADVAGNPAALPLLGFTTRALWERRDRAFRTLTRAAYESLGGVAGALGSHADGVLRSLPAGSRELVREIFHHLVTAAGTRAVLSHAQLMQLLGDRPRAAQVVERLVDERLLSTSEVNGRVQIEIVHEALLDAWPRLVAWRRESSRGAVLRDQVRAAAAQWSERGRPGGLLWRDDALAELRRWRRSAAKALTHDERAFADASEDADRGARRRRQAWIGGALVALLSAVVALAALYQIARDSRARALAESRAALTSAQRAEHRLTALLVTQGREELLRGSALRATAFLAEAYQRGAEGEAVRFLIGAASRSWSHVVASLAGHGGAVTHVVATPDGERIATASADGAVRLWTGDGTALATLLGHTDVVVRLAFSADGRRLASASRDGTARLWAPATGALVAALEHGGEVWAAAFSPDGRRLATGGAGGEIALWDAASGALERRLDAGEAVVYDAQFDPAGERLLSVGFDGIARSWQVSTGRELRAIDAGSYLLRGQFVDGDRIALAGAAGYVSLRNATTGRELARMTGHRGDVRSFAVSPAGDELATASADGTLRLWSLTDGTERVTIEVGAPTWTVAYDAAGERLIASASDGRIGVWDAATGHRLATFDGHWADARVAVAGDRIASAGMDGQARIWRLDGPASARALGAATAPLRSARYDGSGARLITADASGAVRVFDATTARPIAAWNAGAELWWAALSPDASVAALARSDGVIDLVDAATGQLERRLTGHTGSATMTAFSRDGRWLATSSDDGTVAVWDPATGRRRHLLDGHGAGVWGLAFSPDGTELATACDDGVVRVWRLATGALVRELVGHEREVHKIAYSADGQTLASASLDQSVKLWRADTGALVRSIDGDARLNDVDLDDRAALVVAAGLDGDIYVWSTEDGALLDRLRGHASYVASAQFRPGSRELVSASEDATVRLWPAPPSAPTPADFRALAACRSPYRVLDGRVTRRPLPAACGEL